MGAVLQYRQESDDIKPSMILITVYLYMPLDKSGKVLPPIINNVVKRRHRRTLVQAVAGSDGGMKLVA